jgi:single-strand DNA-binding protein
MAGYNRIIMMGNLTRDPELRQLPTGATVCRFGMASNRQFKNRQTGAVTQDVCFVDVDVWGAQADSCNQYLQKGRPVLVEGRLKFDSWKDAEGQNRSKYSIVAETVQFLGGGQGGDQGGDAQVPGDFGGDTGAGKSGRSNPNVLSGQKLDEQPFGDDLPF